MKIIEAIRNFEVTASGGFAIYIILCTTFVTFLEIVQVWHFVKNLFS